MGQFLGCLGGSLGFLSWGAAAILGSPLFPPFQAFGLFLLLLFAPIYRAQAPPHSLWASPHNLLEARLVSSAGGWTSLLFSSLLVASAPLTRPSPAAILRLLCRWLVGVAFHRSAPFLARRLEAATGSCWSDAVGGLLLIPDRREPISCRGEGRRWEGFRPSPQAFALVHCGLGLAEEVGALGRSLWKGRGFKKTTGDWPGWGRGSGGPRGWSWWSEEGPEGLGGPRWRSWWAEEGPEGLGGPRWRSWWSEEGPEGLGGPPKSLGGPRWRSWWSEERPEGLGGPRWRSWRSGGPEESLGGPPWRTWRSRGLPGSSGWGPEGSQWGLEGPQGWGRGPQSHPGVEGRGQRGLGEPQRGLGEPQRGLGGAGWPEGQPVDFRGPPGGPQGPTWDLEPSRDPIGPPGETSGRRKSENSGIFSWFFRFLPWGRNPPRPPPPPTSSFRPIPRPPSPSGSSWPPIGSALPTRPSSRPTASPIGSSRPISSSPPPTLRFSPSPTPPIGSSHPPASSRPPIGSPPAFAQPAWAAFPPPPPPPPPPGWSAGDDVIGEEPKVPGVALAVLHLLNVALIFLWAFLLLITFSYRQDWSQNAAGAAIGWGVWVLTYRVWYRYPWSPGPPGLEGLEG